MVQEEPPPRRGRSPTARLPTLLTVAALGAAMGGVLGVQGERLGVVATELRGVLDSPALGGRPAPPPDPSWLEAQRQARVRAEIDRAIADPWPRDRLMVASEPAGGAQSGSAAASRPAAPTPAPVAAYPSLKRSPFSDEDVSPTQSSAFVSAGDGRPQAAAAAAATQTSPSSSSPRGSFGSRAASRVIRYGAAARGAIMAVGSGPVFNFLGKRRTAP